MRTVSCQSSKDRTIRKEDPSQLPTTETSVKKDSTAEDRAANTTEVLTLQLHLVRLVELQCGMHKIQLLAQNLDKRQFLSQSPEAPWPSNA